MENVGRGAAGGDFDGDGDEDVLVTRCGEPPALLCNEGGNRSQWMEQGSLELLFGRGDERAGDVEVRWPLGEVDRVSGADASSRLTVLKAGAPCEPVRTAPLNSRLTFRLEVRMRGCFSTFGSIPGATHRSSRRPAGPEEGRETMKMQRERMIQGWWCTLTAIVLAGALAVSSSCGREEERLPGRSRPLLAHNWPHPRDFRFEPSSFKAPEPAAVTTRTGLRAYIVQDENDPVVRVTAALPLGRFYEQAGEAGAAALLTQILTRRGPADRERPLSARLADLGSELQVEEGPTLTRISVEALAEDWRPALALIIDLLRHPDVDESFIRGYRAGSGYSEPTAGVAGSGFRPKVELERLLGGYPLAPPDPDSTLAPAAVRAIAERSLGANRVVLGVGGGLPRADAESALEELSQGWSASSGDLPLVSSAERAGSGPPQTIEAPYLEGWIAIGRAIAPVAEGDGAAFAVMASIFNTRLNIAIREIRGLANRAVLELPETASGAGLLHIRTGGRLEAVGPLVKFSLEELDRMQSASDAITAEELDRAKGALVLGSWQGSLDGARQASTTYAAETVLRGSTEGLLKWPAAVQAVTAEQVKAVSLKYLKPSEMKTVIVGPIEKIRPARHPRWPVGLDELVGKIS